MSETKDETLRVELDEAHAEISRLRGLLRRERVIQQELDHANWTLDEYRKAAAAETGDAIEPTLSIARLREILHEGPARNGAEDAALWMVMDYVDNPDASVTVLVEGTWRKMIAAVMAMRLPTPAKPTQGVLL